MLRSIQTHQPAQLPPLECFGWRVSLMETMALKFVNTPRLCLTISQHSTWKPLQWRKVCCVVAHITRTIVGGWMNISSVAITISWKPC